MENLDEVEPDISENKEEEEEEEKKP